MLASLTFVTPLGGLLALSVALPLAAYGLASTRAARGRALLGLAAASSGRWVTLSLLVSIPLLLGFAAAGPVLRTHVGSRVRNDAQAVFIFDTSRSMAAAPGRGSPTRLAQARAAAIALRETAMPEVPAGVASLTTQILPHLFPTASRAVFDSTVTSVIGIEKPPPPALAIGLTGTSFRPLVGLRDQGFFKPAVVHRFAVLLTDGESAQFDADVIGQALRQRSPARNGGGFGGGFGGGGQQLGSSEAPVELFVIRFGGARDRIYVNGAVEAGYRPDPRADEIARSLAATTGGHAYEAADLSSAEAALRKAIGTGGGALQGSRPKSIALAPYVVLLAAAVLLVLVFRTNLKAV